MLKIIIRACSVMTSVLLFVLLPGCIPKPMDATNYSIRLHAARYLNPDINGTPKPLMLVFFQLRSAKAFQQQTVQALLTSPNSTLDHAVVDKQTQVLRPDEHRLMSLRFFPDVRYLGVIATYRLSNPGEAKQIIPLTQVKFMRIDLYAGAHGVLLRVIKSHHSDNKKASSS